MRRYFFHLYDDEVVIDEEGTELPNDAAAREFAITNIRDVAAGMVTEGGINFKHWITVADARGQELFTVRFVDAIMVEGIAYLND